MSIYISTGEDIMHNTFFKDAAVIIPNVTECQLTSSHKMKGINLFTRKNEEMKVYFVIKETSYYNSGKAKRRILAEIAMQYLLLRFFSCFFLFRTTVWCSKIGTNELAERNVSYFPRNHSPPKI